jgi:class 3 adenylate cyclase
LNQSRDLEGPTIVPVPGSPLLGVFLFTDIEGSTRLWAEHQDEMGLALQRHDAVLSEAIKGAGGQVFKHTGDGMCAVFPSVSKAVAAAAAAQRGLAVYDWGGPSAHGGPCGRCGTA